MPQLNVTLNQCLMLECSKPRKPKLEPDAEQDNGGSGTVSATYLHDCDEEESNFVFVFDRSDSPYTKKDEHTKAKSEDCPRKD